MTAARIRVLVVDDSALMRQILGTLLNIGQSNADFVATFLRAESIPVVASDMLGNLSRKVCFFPSSGRVLVRSLRNGDDAALAAREAEYAAGLSALAAGGRVEFFQ